MILYLFNPEHDYALANNDPHFMAPASAVKFADDCALFLRYIAPNDGIIFLPYRKEKPFYDIANAEFTDQPGHIDKIRPWGWNLLMRQQCSEIMSDYLLDNQHITTVRALSHRINAIDAMDFLRAQCPELEIPVSATLLLSPEEVADFVHNQKEVILKSPYSGNGRGNLYAHNGDYSPTLQRQSSGVIRRQGAILGEPLYDVVQDFAMEFLCHDESTQFAGYSLFNTKHYGYAGNLLWSDEAIEERLGTWTSKSTLHQIRQALLTYIQTNIANRYEGYLGVDMFIYKESERYLVNPMVEINVRMTMGMAAHILYEKHVHPQSTGTMQLEYYPKNETFMNFVQQQPTMETKDGKWYSGFLALTPVDKETQYAICVNLEPQK